MLRKVISFILIFTFLFSVALDSFTMLKVFATPVTLHVHPGQSIQAAINSANSGATIGVDSGVYNEHIVVNKSVSLIGENPSNTIIDGSGTGSDTVRISPDINNVKIEGFTIQNGDNPFQPASLRIARSKNQTINNNIIRQSYYGLRIENCNESCIINNVIVDNTYAGLYISSSSYDNVIGNMIEDNLFGAWLADGACINNTFYHNNFVNNTGLYQARSFAPTTKWDNGVEGNYWSDYNGEDLDGDGIGDTNDCNIHACIPHLGLDFYPLIDEWSETRDFSFDWKGVTYHTIVRCNSTVASFNFNHSLAQISFNVTGPQNAVSFCNVTINKSLLNGTFTILVDGTPKNYVLTQNSTHTSLYFTFSHSVRKIQISLAGVADYTLYYVFIGIVAGTVIIGATLFLSKKRKKAFSSPKIKTG